MKKLLILEDEWILDSFRRICEQQFDVVTARTEADARALFDDSIDIALVDACLETSPYDGVRFLRWLRERQPHLPVVMMSAYEEFGPVRDALNLGAAYWLTKPFKLQDLMAALLRLSRE